MAASSPTANASSSASATGPPTRFELELEFVTLLANPFYLAHLAATRMLQRDSFVAYLCYLNAYWRQPHYSRYLPYPGPTLRALEMLQQDQFRKDILRPEVLQKWADTLVRDGRIGPTGATSVSGEGK